MMWIVLEKITKNKEFIKNNKLTLKSLQRFRIEKHVFTGEVNKIVCIEC